MPIFDRLSSSAFQSLAYVLIPRDFTRNTVVLKQGMECEDIFFILSGSCKVVREVENIGPQTTTLRQGSVLGASVSGRGLDDTGSSTGGRLFLEVGVLRRYDYFGEASVIHRTLQESTVITTCQTRMYVLNKWDFLKRIDKSTVDAIAQSVNDNPNDDELRKEFYKNERWEDYKRTLVRSVLESKSRKTNLFRG